MLISLPQYQTTKERKVGDPTIVVNLQNQATCRIRYKWATKWFNGTNSWKAKGIKSSEWVPQRVTSSSGTLPTSKITRAISKPSIWRSRGLRVWKTDSHFKIMLTRSKIAIVIKDWDGKEARETGILSRVNLKTRTAHKIATVLSISNSNWRGIQTTWIEVAYLKEIKWKNHTEVELLFRLQVLELT